MVKALRCSSCGAGLQPTTGQPNVVCEYCNSFVRVADDRSAQFNTEAILSQIVKLWPRVRSDDFTSDYEKIKDLISEHKYVEANRQLSRILEMDNTQSRAWFYKSLLPILEQETVVFKGCHVNVVKVSKTTSRAHMRAYLRKCGLSGGRQKQFLDFYRSTDFLYVQHVKFLDKAIEHASTAERTEFFKTVKEKRVKLQKQILRRRRWSTIGLILLLAVVVGGACFAVWYFCRDLLNG